MCAPRSRPARSQCRSARVPARADESGASQLHKKALVDPSFSTTELTRAFTGQHTRGLRNRFIRAHDAAPSAYPEIHHLTRPLRAATVAGCRPERDQPLGRHRSPSRTNRARSRDRRMARVLTPAAGVETCGLLMVPVVPTWGMNWILENRANLRLVLHRHVRHQHPGAAPLRRRTRRQLDRHALRPRGRLRHEPEARRDLRVRGDRHQHRNRGRHLPAREATERNRLARIRHRSHHGVGLHRDRPHRASSRS